MTVSVLSFGSLWLQHKRNETVVWNTTGVYIGNDVRSRACHYGVVRMSASDAHRVGARAAAQSTLYTASELECHSGTRTLHLIRPAGHIERVERVLAVVRPDLVGFLDFSSWDRNVADLVSFSQSGEQQEVMLLMRPFAWVRGQRGVAFLDQSPRGIVWNVQRR